MDIISIGGISKRYPLVPRKVRVSGLPVFREMMCTLSDAPWVWKSLASAGVMRIPSKHRQSDSDTAGHRSTGLAFFPNTSLIRDCVSSGRENVGSYIRSTNRTTGELTWSGRKPVVRHLNSRQASTSRMLVPYELHLQRDFNYICL